MGRRVSRFRSGVRWLLSFALAPIVAILWVWARLFPRTPGDCGRDHRAAGSAAICSTLLRIYLFRVSKQGGATVRTIPGISPCHAGGFLAFPSRTGVFYSSTVVVRLLDVTRWFNAAFLPRHNLSCTHGPTRNLNPGRAALLLCLQSPLSSRRRSNGTESLGVRQGSRLSRFHYHGLTEHRFGGRHPRDVSRHRSSQAAAFRTPA